MFKRPLQLLLVGVLTTIALQDQSFAQDATQEGILRPTVERVLYVPVDEATSENNPRLKRQESALIARYFRTSGLSEEISLLSVDNPSLFRSVEAGLVMQARATRCNDGRGDSLFSHLDQARKSIAAGDLKGAEVPLEGVLEALPCAERKIGRRQLAELFLFRGLVALDAGRTEEGESWIRSGLSVEEEIKTSALIPEHLVKEMERLAFETENNQKVDARISPEQGELWTPRNLIIDGRRMIFDRMFLELVPGYHFVQVALPDGSSWGALLYIESGKMYDIIEGVRQTLSLRELYQNQIKKVVDQGALDPALEHGLRYYAKTLHRDQIYLARIFVQPNGQAELTIRRFHVERGLEIPEELGADSTDANAGWVPVKYAPPWATDLSFNFSQIQAPDIGYKATGLGLEFNARYLLTQRFYLGASMGGGVRFSTALGGDNTNNVSTNPDLTASAFGGIDIPLGPIAIRADVGYLQHVLPLQDLAFGCQLRGTSADSLMYACSEDFSTELEPIDGEQTPIPFGFQGIGGGPRFRLALLFSPGKGEDARVQGLLRAGYTPIVLNLPRQGSAVVGGQDVQYEFIDESYSQILHRLDLNFGVSATF